MKPSSFRFYLTLSASFLLFAGLVSCKSTPKKILFLGNRYTDGIQKTFKTLLADSPYRDVDATFVCGGGSLDTLIGSGRAQRAIKRKKWDVVVIQDSSLFPFLPGGEKRFNRSVDTLVEEIRKVGAEPILYMTWARRDGLSIRSERLSVEEVHKKVSEAYHSTARRHRIRLATVGEAWALLRSADPALGHALYQLDGSNPSEKGAYLASCVFFNLLFGDDLKQIGTIEGLSDSERDAIKRVVSVL